MRKRYERILRVFFCRVVRRTRANMGITQEEMADRLAMSGRSYLDLEHGDAGCSGLTLAMFLAFVCEDPVGFLEGFRVRIEAETETMVR